MGANAPAEHSAISPRETFRGKIDPIQPIIICLLKVRIAAVVDVQAVCGKCLLLGQSGLSLNQANESAIGLKNRHNTHGQLRPKTCSTSHLLT